MLAERPHAASSDFATTSRAYVASAPQPTRRKEWRDSEEVDVPPELGASAEQRAAKAEAEIRRLQEQVDALQSWLAAGAETRTVEYIQAQRFALMKALERESRRSFVLSLPLLLVLVYCTGLGVFVWWLLKGPL